MPIVEPEVSMDGDHSQQRCQGVTEAVLRSVFEQLTQQGVVREAMILKPNMVLAGLACAVQPSADDVAYATLQCLRRVVPAAVAGIAFLSGGQFGEEACRRLSAMHIQHDVLPETRRNSCQPALPWLLSFSFGQALQQPALNLRAGNAAKRGTAQQALLYRARCNCAALKGDYDASLEAR